MNQPHYLRKIKTTRIPRRIVCFDTESFGDIKSKEPNTSLLTFRLCCASSFVRTGERWESMSNFETRIPGHFWDWLLGMTHAREKLWIFAHGIGFDLTMLDFWGRLSRGEFVTKQHRRPCICEDE